MAKVLVTGGAGFVGSHVADELTRVGHEVRIMDRRPSPYRHPDQEEARKYDRSGAGGGRPRGM